MSTKADTPDWEKKLAKLPFASGGFTKEMMQQVKERTTMKQEKKFKPLRMVLIALAAVVCSAGIWQHERIGEAVGAMFSPDGSKLKPMDKNADIKLKVFTPYGDQFVDQYGRAFMIRNPNVNITPISPSSDGVTDVSSMTQQQLEDWLEKERPDVVELKPEQYEPLAKSGKLYALDAVIKQDAFDLGSFQPSVIRALRDLGDGGIYGLAPFASSYALFYNKDLFDQYGIDYPTDNMSWDEVLQLAARFPTSGQGDNRVFGLDTPYGPFELISDMGRTLELSMTNNEGTATTLDSKSWSSLWHKVTDGFRKGYITQAIQVEGSLSLSDYIQNHPFLSGKAAMTVNDYSLMNYLDSEIQKAGIKQFHWDVATEPVDPAKRNQATTFKIPTIYAVNAKSGNLRAAWELVKYVNSPESARKQARAKIYMLLSRTAFQPPDGEHHLEAFFKLEPNVWQMTQQRNRALYAIGDAEADAVVRGEKTVEQALADATVQANRLLKGNP